MKKTLIASLILLFITLFALGIKENTTTKPSDNHLVDIIGDFKKGIVIIVDEHKKYGLYDSINQKNVTPIKYDDINCFANEHAMYYVIAGKYGYLDEKGTEIIPAVYDFATGFSDGLAAVQLNGKWGYINKSGQVTVPIIYEMAWTFNSGLGAVKKNGKWGFIDTKGKFVLDPIYDYVTTSFSEKTNRANVTIFGRGSFYIDKNGKYLRKSTPEEAYKE
jgi:hypothetical protein